MSLPVMRLMAAEALDRAMKIHECGEGSQDICLRRPVCRAGKSKPTF